MSAGFEGGDVLVSFARSSHDKVPRAGLSLPKLTALLFTLASRHEIFALIVVVLSPALEERTTGRPGLAKHLVVAFMMVPL